MWNETLFGHIPPREYARKCMLDAMSSHEYNVYRSIKTLEDQRAWLEKFAWHYSTLELELLFGEANLRSVLGDIPSTIQLPNPLPKLRLSTNELLKQTRVAILKRTTSAIHQP